MSNEVEIVVSSRDRTGPGLAAARGKASAFAASTKATLGKAGVEAGQALGDGIVRGAGARLRDSRGRFVRGGQDLGDGIAEGIESGTRRGDQIVGGFTSSVLSSFRKLGPGMGAAVTAGLYGAAASAGTAAGAVTLAVGGALTAIGAVSAAQSVKVRQEWSAVGQEVKADLADAAQPMERSALRAATVTRATFSRLKPYLSSFFSDSAPAVDRFVRSIGDGVASLGPALVPLERGYSAVLDRLSARSPAIFGALQRSIENVAETAEEHADDIAGAFEFAARAVEFTTEAVDALADSWSDFTGDVSDFTSGNTDFGKGFADGLYDLYESLGINTEHMQKMREEWAKTDAAAANNGGVKGASSAASDLGGAADDAAAGLRDLKAEFERLTGPALDAAEAQLRVEEAIDRAAEAVRENGRTLDIHSEKGRANKDALIDLARASQEHLVAMQNEEASAGAIAEKYSQYRGQLVQAARQAGATKAEAESLAAAWLAVPESVTTAVRGNIGDLESKIAAAKARLRDPKLTRPERAQIRAEISDLQRKVAAAKAALASVNGSRATTFIDTIYRYSGKPRVGSGTVLAPGLARGGIVGGLGGVKRFAQGGVSGSGSSLAMVGEQGPELVRLPVGSSVTGAGQTRAVLGGGGGFGSISMAFRSGGGGSESGGLASSMRDLTKALREVVSLRDGMSRFTDSVFGQGRALMAYEEAWDAVRRSMKENGKSLNITKEKGRENRTALMGLADAAHQVAFAMRDMGKPTSEIVAKMREQRAEFIKMARAFGLTKKEATALADKWGLIPSKVKSVLTKESADLAYNKQAEAFNARLDGKATGGPAGGWTMVGERGAELVKLPFGSQVTSANQTAAMLASGAAPAPTVIELRSSGSAIDDMLLQILRKAIRVRGGNVQLVLGRT
ncbi:hypothetical protein [Nonomuraea sp. GTA35]|uniref:hypothetical protein n=1 Tax=Nonomuraea sp. GTA35 TaxID=1676746 RepID=UPI0035C0A33F